MDINQIESVNTKKFGLTVLSVESLNEIPATIINSGILSILCKNERNDDFYDEPTEKENESTINENDILIRSNGEPEATDSAHGTEIDPLSNDDQEETRPPGMDMDLDDLEGSISSVSSSAASFMKDLSATNQTIFDGTLFALNVAKAHSCGELVAKCKLCKPSKEIRGSSSIIPDFQTHLKRVHGDFIVDNLMNHISKKARLNDKITHYLLTPSATPTPTIPSPTVVESEKSSNSNQQLLFNNSVLNYFLKSFTPFTAVELPEFREMFNNSDVRIVSKKHLTTQIHIKMKMIKNQIITLLQGVNFVCISIDMWSSESHHYLAITCHWIDEVTFKRRSVVLICKRLDSSSDSFNVEKHLRKTLNNYKLPKTKVTSYVTKNFYNFSKIFKELNIPTTVNTDNINEDNSVSIQTTELLPYVCYTKTLSLIATIDIPNAIDSRPMLRSIHESALKKVYLFIFLASSDATLAPMLTDLKKPDILKWNSIYDAIAYFLKLEQKRSFAELLDLLKIEQFTDAELMYLREYVTCFRPLALAFERLQCEQGSYHGFILPTLIELRKKCEKLLENKDLVFCGPLLKTIQAKSLQRFSDFFKSSPKADRVIIASLSHPQFKEKWVSAMEGLEKDTVRRIFIETITKENSKFDNTNMDVQEEDMREEEIDDFYFGDEEEEERPKKNTKKNLTIELEALRYLVDYRRNLTMLDDYPAVKRVFLKYNTSLSSSEAVERVFPFETRQHIARYGCLTEDFFEERVLLILNKDYLVS